MVETEFLKEQEIKPLVWLRYIDDIFFVWLEGEDKLLQFMKKLNEFHPSLKFAYEYSRTKVNFLDVVVKIDAGQLISSPYFKSTHCHQYLHYESSHPAHVKRCIVYSQGLRIKRIGSRKEDFEKHLQDLSTWVRNRAYPTSLIEKEFRRIREYNIQEDTSTLVKSCKRGVSFTITFHPSLKHSGLDSKSVVYLLTCKVCKKQYVRQTTDKFRFRWNNYKACQRKALSDRSRLGLAPIKGPCHSSTERNPEIFCCPECFR